MAPRGLLRALWIWGPLFAYLALIFYLSSLPQIGWAADYPDYVEHALEYCGLAIFMARALNGGLGRRAPWRILAMAFLLCTVYAITDEIHQYFVPNRFSDVRDVASDAVGAGTGLLALRLAQRLQPGLRS